MLGVRHQSEATLDPKGRVAMPAPIKKALADVRAQLVAAGKLADGAEVPLVLMPVKGHLWLMLARDFEARIEAPLLAVDPLANDVMDHVHAMVASANDVELDSVGRLLIPQRHRELAGLDRELVMHSVLDRFEIWDKARWELRFQKAQEIASSRSGTPRGGP